MMHKVLRTGLSPETSSRVPEKNKTKQKKNVYMDRDAGRWV